MNLIKQTILWIALCGFLSYSKAEKFGNGIPDDGYFHVDHADEQSSPEKTERIDTDSCDAKTEKCRKKTTSSLTDDFVKETSKFLKENAHQHDSVPKMMEHTGEFLVDLGAKYLKEYSEGKLSLVSLLTSMPELTSMVMRSSLPGGNPLAASAAQFSQKLFASLLEYGQKTIAVGGLDLKPFVDESHAILNTVVPGLVIALQHADKNCRKPALCRAARAATQSPYGITQSLGPLLAVAVATFVDVTDKPSKKNSFMKVYECCSIKDKQLFEKCSKKYFDDDECSGHKISNPNLLKPIPLDQIRSVIRQLSVLSAI